MAPKKRRQEEADRTEELLDEALEESFPASDPPSLVGPGGGISGPEDTATTDAHSQPITDQSAKKRKAR
jgi:hypothetical protein